MPLEHLEVATKNLQDAHRNAHEAQAVLQEARRVLANREMTVTLDGLVGPNAETRKEYLRAETYDARQEAEAAEAAHTEAKLNITIANLEYDFAREACAMHRARITSTNPRDLLSPGI